MKRIETGSNAYFGRDLHELDESTARPVDTIKGIDYLIYLDSWTFDLQYFALRCPLFRYT